MSTAVCKKQEVQYHLDNASGAFVIENYNQSKPFSNFFPGVAGVWGTPMWAFFVNRGQGIASFGIESKDKAILEFQPANKAYRSAALQGFRTFIKVKRAGKVIYWEPFQQYLLGTDFKKQQTMAMTAHDLTLTEVNEDLGLIAEVNYFTLPEEAFPALVRRVIIKNVSGQATTCEIVDGLPAIMPYGLKDWLAKNMARTAEAWVKVRHLDKKAPYYQLNVEIADTPQVTYVKEGNFYMSFDAKARQGQLLTPIVEATTVFGPANDFTAPAAFLADDFQLPTKQQTSNRTACAMSYGEFDLGTDGQAQMVTLVGMAHSEGQLDTIVSTMASAKVMGKKAQRNEEIISGVKEFALTNSASNAFNLYAGHTFLDNILRGGLPVSLDTSDGPIAFNVYSRKHGDLERDYNFFLVAPTFYSQGNGNYRDVNQNRRNDVWFNGDVKASSLVNFLNLLQADGYNPLVVKGTAFTVKNVEALDDFFKTCLKNNNNDLLREFLAKAFQPGEVLSFLDKHQIDLKVLPQEFLGHLLSLCQRKEVADHGEGFWTDHWTYNLDLIESYFSLYPEALRGLLLERNIFSFYLNNHYVLPRDQRYILTERGVRQYESVASDDALIGADQKGRQLRVKGGAGDVYTTTLLTKLLALIANKAASLDPSGIGIEMEADKPNWYDSLNGLPGLLGSSISESFELKRYSLFLLEAFKALALEDDKTVQVYEELAAFITGLTNVLSFEDDALAYWGKSNDLKEAYRQRVRVGIEGAEKAMTIGEVKHFLEVVVKRSDMGIAKARNEEGFLATYFYHVVEEYKILDKGQDDKKNAYVRPEKFKCHALPLFLEGYVHALRVETDIEKRRALYTNIRQSDLFDKKLNMYKVNVDLSGETEEIGRSRIFPSGWLENESIWLHMEYKFMLELIRGGLFTEFYENFRHVLVPFLSPEKYGRSTLENSSFIVSSAHEDESLHGQGFVARLSGSTAEFLHIWLLMNVGPHPFTIDKHKNFILTFNPALEGTLFTEEVTSFVYTNGEGVRRSVKLPAHTYAFKFLGNTLVVYHNPQRKDTFGSQAPLVKSIQMHYLDGQQETLTEGVVSSPFSLDVREGCVERIDVFFA